MSLYEFKMKKDSFTCLQLISFKEFFAEKLPKKPLKEQFALLFLAQTVDKYHIVFNVTIIIKNIMTHFILFICSVYDRLHIGTNDEIKALLNHFRYASISRYK